MNAAEMQAIQDAGSGRERLSRAMSSEDAAREAARETLMRCMLGLLGDRAAETQRKAAEMVLRGLTVRGLSDEELLAEVERRESAAPRPRAKAKK